MEHKQSLEHSSLPLLSLLRDQDRVDRDRDRARKRGGAAVTHAVQRGGKLTGQLQHTGGVAHRPLGGDGLLHGKTPAELQIVQIQRGMEGQNTVRLLHDF